MSDSLIHLQVPHGNWCTPITTQMLVLAPLADRSLDGLSHRGFIHSNVNFPHKKHVWNKDSLSHWNVLYNPKPHLRWANLKHHLSLFVKIHVSFPFTVIHAFNRSFCFEYYLFSYTALVHVVTLMKLSTFKRMNVSRIKNIPAC